MSQLKDVLIIIAHPDDETIWMGGTILKNKNKWNTTIISLCRRDDNDRAPKFKKVCKTLNAKPIISNLEDENLNPISVDKITDKIKKLLPKKNYDIIFTHGTNGEYGHIRHIETHNAVKQMLKKNILSSTKTFFFSYLKKSNHCIANKNSDKFITLNNIQLTQKKYLIRKVYGFDRGSFEEKSSKKIEAFNLNKK